MAARGVTRRGAFVVAAAIVASWLAFLAWLAARA